MPIKGLTTETNTGAGLPVIAKLYKGSEKQVREKNGREYEIVGKDLDHFRVEFEPQFAYLLPIWKEMYGDEPTEFAPLFLTAATVDEAFASWKEEWNSTQTLLHRCDGEHQVMWWNEAAQMYGKSKIACASPVNPQTGVADNPKCACKSVGRLSVIMPEFVQAAGVLGYISIVTHSINDILTVYRYLADIERMYGRLTGVPFIFGRAMKEVSAPKQVKRNGQYVNEGRIKTQKSLFYLHVEPAFMQERLLPRMAAVAALPANVNPETGEILSTSEARSLLGSGGGVRRLGAPAVTPPQAEVIDAEPASSVEPPVDTHWTKDAARVEKFRAWALERFNYGDAEIVSAFSTAAGDSSVEAITDWVGTDYVAMGAVIAQYYDYDEGQITRSCRNYKAPEIQEAALKVAKFIHERNLPTAEPQ